MLETIANLLSLTGAAVGIGKGGIELAKDIQELIKSSDADPALKRLVSELFDQQIKLQAEHIAMQSAVLQLHEEQRRLDRFKSEADRYTLIRTEQGSLVYELKPSYADSEPTHCICATCYERHIKSILQPIAHNTLTCGTCGGTFYKPDGQDSGIRVARARRTDFDGFI